LFQQRTIGGRITCRGVGLHSGEPVSIALRPAPPDTGVVFERRQDDRTVSISARPESISASANATTLSADGLSVATVEHLLAALRCRGVDNVVVEVDGPELPVMDGSAASFDYLIRDAELAVQPAVRALLVVRRPLVCRDGERTIRIEPAGTFHISYAIDFPHPAIGRQELEIRDLTPGVFESELSRARTFGFLDQVEGLRRAGLARGASLDNTVVLDAHGVMNEGGLRWRDEFVRHKVLDLVGDLALLGHPIRGHVQVERGGHALHHALVAALTETPDAWKLVPGSVAAAPGGGPAEYVAPI
jgi:UDP-3-O-[3-hydroxymyristoyl] N-acetylglucosamine deacetylase